MVQARPLLPDCTMYHQNIPTHHFQPCSVLSRRHPDIDAWLRTWLLAHLAGTEDVQEALAAEQDQLAAQARPQQIQPLVAVLPLCLQGKQGSCSHRWHMMPVVGHANCLSSEVQRCGSNVKR